MRAGLMQSMCDRVRNGGLADSDIALDRQDSLARVQAQQGIPHLVRSIDESRRSGELTSGREGGGDGVAVASAVRQPSVAPRIPNTPPITASRPATTSTSCRNLTGRSEYRMEIRHRRLFASSRRWGLLGGSRDSSGTHTTMEARQYGQGRPAMRFARKRAELAGSAWP